VHARVLRTGPLAALAPPVLPEALPVVPVLVRELLNALLQQLEILLALLVVRLRLDEDTRRAAAHGGVTVDPLAAGTEDAAPTAGQEGQVDLPRAGVTRVDEGCPLFVKTHRIVLNV